MACVICPTLPVRACYVLFNPTLRNNIKLTQGDWALFHLNSLLASCLDNEYIVAADGSRNVTVYDAATGAVVRDLSCSHDLAFLSTFNEISLC